jgi:hypothetical protein
VTGLVAVGILNTIEAIGGCIDESKTSKLEEYASL